MTKLTNIDINEYRAIPITLRQMMRQLTYLHFINDVLGAERILDEMAILRRRRRQLRRAGAY